MRRRKTVIALLLLLALLVLAGCGAQKIVHCDRCGREIRLDADSRITEEWIVFCKECEEEIGPVVEPSGK